MKELHIQAEYITVYETDNFKVEVVPRPHVSREEGGHLRIKSREKNFGSRMDLSPVQAKRSHETFNDNWRSIKKSYDQ